MKAVLLAILTLFILANTAAAHEVSIHMTENGFEPKTLEIDVGETVTFENTVQEDRWPASNIHPTHAIYSEFDPKEPVQPGKSWSFTFDKPGKWGYHDHLHPAFSGTIAVVGEEATETSIFAKFWNMILNFFRPVDTSGTTIIETSTPTPDPRYNDSVTIDSEEIFTNEEILYSYVKKYGPKQATQHLYGLVPKYGDCHQQAHTAGHFAYEIYKDQAFRLCSSECHSGCYHGATEAYFKEHGTKNLDQDLNLLCASELNGFFSHQCIHGIGHGLMAWTNYEIFEALESCDLLDRRQDSCWTGVFMENIVGGLAEGHKTEYLSQDPHYPCSIVDEKYKTACYFLQTSRMVELFGGNFSKIAEACIQAGVYQRTCFESMGRDIGGFYRTDPKQGIAACTNAPAGELRNGCISGYVQDSFWTPDGQDASIAICKMLDSQEKQSCYDTIFIRAPDILNTKEALTQFCEKVEEEYQQDCLQNVFSTTY